VFPEPLPGNDKWNTHRDTQTEKYACEMGSGAMIYEYIPCFREIGSGMQKLIGEYIDTQTAR
jgi:hypothetical protein